MANQWKTTFKGLSSMALIKLSCMGYQVWLEGNALTQK